MIEQSDPQLLLMLALLGAVLGGAIGHWRRGRDMIVTGAIIGAITLPLLGIGAAMVSGIIVLLVIAAVVIGILGSIFAG